MTIIKKIEIGCGVHVPKITNEKLGFPSGQRG